MASLHGDEIRAETYRLSRWVFRGKGLSGKKVMVTGGAGALGAASVFLVVREDTNLVVR
jgi:FlaA1/EpsC-like NDP-sugar epimerase